jgi:predicted transcriptional regulator of viral defense system
MAYICLPKASPFRTEPFLLANQIFGPSYVSFDSALSYYGLIPERVYEITSATIRASKRFATPGGSFSFIRLPLPYYSFGIQSLEIVREQHILIASPEKALFDKIATIRGIHVRSVTSAGDFPD